MFFCPFCGTLLLFNLEESQKGKFFCSTCSFIVPLENTGEGLTETHDFRHLNFPTVDTQTSAERSTEIELKKEEKHSSVKDSQSTANNQGSTSLADHSTSEARGTTEQRANVGGQIMSVRCENTECDSTSAYYVQTQIRSADEPATIFYKCVKCEHVWRQE